MGGGGGDAPAESGSTEVAKAAEAAPAAAKAAAPAPAAATPATPAAPEPTPPWVEAAQTRKKIPFWAVPVLFLLPVWAIIYALTLDPPTVDDGPLVVGDEVYNGKGCSGCHGATGAGAGSIPALVGDTAPTEVFPRPVDQVAWIALGSDGWQQAGLDTLPNGTAVNGGMPAWADSLTAEELMAVTLHTRATFNGEAFDAAVWEEGFEETITELVPDKAEEYLAVLEEWAADPPV
jgi:mono/diheme cytochrome c family protein